MLQCWFVEHIVSYRFVSDSCGYKDRVTMSVFSRSFGLNKQLDLTEVYRIHSPIKVKHLGQASSWKCAVGAITLLALCVLQTETCLVSVSHLSAIQVKQVIIRKHIHAMIMPKRLSVHTDTWSKYPEMTDEEQILSCSVSQSHTSHQCVVNSRHGARPPNYHLLVSLSIAGQGQPFRAKFRTDAMV